MIHAYDKLYLQDAQSNLAAMLDYAVKFLDYELNFFYKMFVNSKVSKAFSHGDASTIAGKSGAELARIVVEENTKKEWSVPYEGSMQKSPSIGPAGHWHIISGMWGILFQQLTLKFP